MTKEERNELIAKIAELPEILEEVVSDLSDAQLDTPYREGGWTVRQVVHHLADSHMHAYIRMRFMLTQENPTLQPYQQDAWALLADARAAAVESSLLLLKGLHDRWTTLLSSLQDDAWSRKAMHPERGEVTVETLLHIYGNHGEHHVEQIRRLREQKRW